MPLLKPLNPPLLEWRGTTVWLIGASTGIGEATASALHALGAKVVVSARKAQALDAFVQAHPGSRALALDVTNAQAVQDASAQLLAQGPLDCVVYCAGHYHAMRAFAMDVPDMQRHMEVNYTGALQVLNAVLPAMLARVQATSAWWAAWLASGGYPIVWPTAPPKRHSSIWLRRCTLICTIKAWV